MSRSSQVSKFLEGFMSTTLQRLSTAWDRNNTLSGQLSAESQFYHKVYRMCSIPEGFNGLSLGLNAITNSDGEVFTGFIREEIENARDHMIGDVTKTYSDVLAVSVTFFLSILLFFRFMNPILYSRRSLV